MHRFLAAALVSAISAISLGASAQSFGASGSSRIDGLTFSVTTDVNYWNPMPYGYVTPGATAGMWGPQTEWIAGRSEFDLHGQQAAQSVLLSFTFDEVSTTRASVPKGAAVRLGTYTGDNVASLFDFTPTGFAALTSLDVSALPGASVQTFDVTALFNAAVARGDAAFGITLDQRSAADVFASFHDFSLAVTTVNAVTPVPEPSTVALLFAGLGLVVAARRRVKQGQRA